MSAADCDDDHDRPVRDLDTCDVKTTLETSVSFTDRVVVRELGDEAVVLHLDQERFFGLDQVAMRMVSLLREHGRLEPVYRILLDEYDVPADRLRRDLLSFVDLLAQRDLLSVEKADVGGHLPA